LSPYASYLIETLVTLLAVCGLAFALLYCARRLGVGKAQGAIEMVGRLPLDARRSIVLVRVGAHVFLVGVGDGGFTKLGELPAADVPKTESGSPTPFADVLARALGRKEAAGPAPEAKAPKGEEPT
jgi:flagellar protein FliO/FliZ